MNPAAHKVAILHDDPDVVAKVSALAAKAGLDIVRSQSLSWLLNQISDPLLSAVVLDLAGSCGGGFELLEQLCNSPSRAKIVVITSLDAKTLDSTQRLADSKGFSLAIHRKGFIDDAALLRQLCAGRDEAPGFGPEQLCECLDKRYYRVEYQPKVPLSNQSSAGEYGVEALCRIFHPSFGAISPDQFIPLAEKNGLVLRLTDCVVCEAFRDHRGWRQEGLSLRLAVNISPELLTDGVWCDLFLQRCSEFEVDAEQITLEITESSAGATHPAALDILTRLRLKGFTLSIDDFGTGFSSLSTLYKLPFGELKIDKSFIGDLQENAEARALIESTVSLAHRIGLKVVAEGVESEATFRELKLIGCHEAQGFFVGRSMTADKVQRFFSDWAAMVRSQSIHAGTPNALPKIAMIQVLLNDILSDKTTDTDSTLVLSHVENVKSPEGAEEDTTLGFARSIPPLVLQGRTTEALANCHAAASRLEASDTRPGLKSKIARLQSLLEQELITTADLDLVGAHGIARLLPRSSATLGRPSSSATVDIPVTCRWFSRGEKNLRLFTKGGEWFVEDRGSTNGNFVGQKRLEPRRPLALPIGVTIVETGNQVGSAAPVAIRLKRPALDPGSVVITFSFDPEMVREGLDDEQWLALEADLSTTWIIFDSQISLGRAAECALSLEESAAEIAATISFKSGYWITPAQGTDFTLSGCHFSREVPLPSKTQLSVCGAAISVREEVREEHHTPLSDAAPSVSARA
jgi:EAL domain-containing protein (putative c-di-GMP-specific phosphodiesterase class I)